MLPYDLVAREKKAPPACGGTSILSMLWVNHPDRCLWVPARVLCDPSL